MDWQKFDQRVGLCSVCVHARRITSSKGSTFSLCRLSATDKRFRKYPPLPVVECKGFKPAPESGSN